MKLSHTITTYCLSQSVILHTADSSLNITDTENYDVSKWDVWNNSPADLLQTVLGHINVNVTNLTLFLGDGGSLSIVRSLSSIICI